MTFEEIRKTREKINTMIAYEMKLPPKWWFISFFLWHKDSDNSEDGYLGCAFVYAGGPSHALYISWEKKINPGGGCAISTVLEEKAPPEEFQHKLLSKKELSLYDIRTGGDGGLTRETIRNEDCEGCKEK